MSEILTRWQDPTIKELQKQLQQKENIIKEIKEYIESNPLIYIGDTYVRVEDVLDEEKYIEDTKFFKTLFEILDKGENNE